jgi:hypothetical protein
VDKRKTLFGWFLFVDSKIPTPHMLSLDIEAYDEFQQRFKELISSAPIITKPDDCQHA